MQIHRLTPAGRVGYFTIICEVCEKVKPKPKKSAVPHICDDCYYIPKELRYA